MRTGNRNQSLAARSFGSRSVHTIAVAGLLGFLPLAASTAAAPDPAVSPATSTAVVELVPEQPAGELGASAPATQEPAASSPQETVVGRGSASYYAAKFHGRRTASGERFDNDDMTAAHRTLPFGSRVRVTNVSTGRSVVVRINDRGPFTRGRMIDVSRAAAQDLGLIASGHGTVELALLAD